MLNHNLLALSFICSLYSPRRSQKWFTKTLKIFLKLICASCASLSLDTTDSSTNPSIHKHAQASQHSAKQCPLIQPRGSLLHLQGKSQLCSQHYYGSLMFIACGSTCIPFSVCRSGISRHMFRIYNQQRKGQTKFQMPQTIPSSTGLIPEGSGEAS